ncbi:MAG: ligand-binding sensor domain-containing protein/signal transduction histidine kinase [Marivirga sp.]|jgi:ligand-binding sensor domain-containing protein/signal transduction histidine kinase
MKHAFVYLITLVCVAGNLLAQKPYEQLQFQSYTVDRGLSQNIVEAITQDSQGFMWFGTQDGLNRFDGKNFKTYYFKIGDTTSLSNNYVKVIYEDLNGDLWIGTYGGGINKFDKDSTFVRYQYNPKDQQSISDNVAYNIYQNDPDYLWIGTKEGINKMDLKAETFQVFVHRQNDLTSLTNNVIYAVSKSKEEDKIWVGTRSGLNLFNTKTGKVDWSITKFNQKNLDIRDLYLDDAGRLWLGTKGLGLLYLEPEQRTLQYFELADDGKGSSYVRKIYPNDSASLWIGTFGEGLYYVDLKSNVGVHFNKNYKQRSISENRIVDIYQDGASNFWIGTHGGGLNAFNLKANKFDHYAPNKKDSNSLSNASVNYIFEDSHGAVYIATDAGIDLVEDPDSEHLTFNNIIRSNSSELDSRGWLVFEDSRNTLWVGLWNYGLSSYDPESGELVSYMHDPTDSLSIASNYLESMIEDSLGNLWVGLVDGGLDYFDVEKKTFKHYNSEGGGKYSLSNNRVHALSYHDGALWVGTDYGLERYDPSIDGFRHYRYQSNDSLSLNYNIVRVVFEDSFGDLWIGTGGGGISKMLCQADGSVYFKHYTTKDGLPNNNIAAIIEDQNHHLWITTFKGVVRFDPEKEEFRSYSTNDGLQGQEFIRSSAAVISSGKVFIGGFNGLNVFDPNKITDSDYEPSVRLIGVDIFNNEKGQDHLEGNLSNITINQNDYLISFEVAVTDYTAVNKNKFSYQLLGFDNEWIDNGNRRHFSYTNLPAGAYQLKVRATNSDGIWSSNLLNLNISVIPPFWETLWFQLMAVVFIGVLIFGYIRMRVYNLKKSKETLKVLVSERTLEVQITNRKLLEEQGLVTEQKDQITLQHQEIVKQNNIIKRQNDDLKLANLQLEEVVDERTKELRDTNRELFASNHELDTFFYRAAHDLKGPISTILGLTYLALKEGPASHMKVYLDKLDDTAKRMSGILFNLQKINKIKHSSIDMSSFKIEDLVDDALEDNIHDNAHKEHFINYKLTGISGETRMVSDYVLLKIIFSNLFSNALKFSIPGEINRVEIHFSIDVQAKQYRITFQDFGIGIKKEYRDKIFDMFFIATDRNPGTGLGLYSVKMAVKKLGGSIIVDPSLEESSCFLLQLPLPAEELDKIELPV